MVAYVDSNSANRDNAPDVATPAGASGDTLLALALGYTTTATDIWASGTGKADFSKIARTTESFDLSACEAWQRTTDGTEDATYGGTLAADSYGGSFALVRITEGQLQTSGDPGTPGVYAVVDTNTHRVPAHDVDTDGSLAVFLGFGYNQAISNTALVNDGWTQRETGDSNFFCIYTKEVDAGLYPAVTATSDGDGANMLLIFEPVGGGGSPIDGTAKAALSVGPKASISKVGMGTSRARSLAEARVAGAKIAQGTGKSRGAGSARLGAFKVAVGTSKSPLLGTLRAAGSVVVADIVDGVARVALGLWGQTAPKKIGISSSRASMINSARVNGRKVAVTQSRVNVNGLIREAGIKVAVLQVRTSAALLTRQAASKTSTGGAKIGAPLVDRSTGSKSVEGLAARVSLAGTVRAQLYKVGEAVETTGRVALNVWSRMAASRNTAGESRGSMGLSNLALGTKLARGQARVGFSSAERSPGSKIGVMAGRVGSGLRTRIGAARTSVGSSKTALTVRGALSGSRTTGGLAKAAASFWVSLRAIIPTTEGPFRSAVLRVEVPNEVRDVARVNEGVDV